MQLLKAKTGKIIHVQDPDHSTAAGVCVCGKIGLVSTDKATADKVVAKGGAYCDAGLTLLMGAEGIEPKTISEQPDLTPELREQQAAAYRAASEEPKDSLLQSFLAQLAARQAEREKKRAARAKAKQAMRDTRLDPTIFHMPEGDGQRYRRRLARKSVGVVGARARTRQARPHTAGNKAHASLYTHRAYIAQDGVMLVQPLGGGNTRPARSRDRARWFAEMAR